MKQYIEFNDLDVNEVIDFEFIHEEKGRESVENTLNNTTATPEKAKYVRKTIYINRDYLDVLEFFKRKDSSVAICELIRDTLNNTTATPEKAKYVRKTIYINRDYLDVLEFFKRKDSSVAICELIREQLRKEKGLEAQVDLVAIMEAIKELEKKIG